MTSQYIPVRMRADECFRRGFYCTLGGLVAMILVYAALFFMAICLMLAGLSIPRIVGGFQAPPSVSKGR